MTFMYVLMSYDAYNGRTEAFRKALSRYLTHEQNSVFAGNLTEAQLISLKKEIGKLAVPDDRILLIIAENRHNVSVVQLHKEPGNNTLFETAHDHHAKCRLSYEVILRSSFAYNTGARVAYIRLFEGKFFSFFALNRIKPLT